MSIAIIVDAACDLPADYCKRHNIHIIPVGVDFGDRIVMDKREPEMARLFYKDYSHFSARNAHSLPPATSAIKEFILDNIVDHYEGALLMCLTSSRSEIYNNAREAGKQVMDAVRLEGADRQTKLRTLRIMDTRTLFTGQALLAYEAYRVSKLVHDVGIQELYEVLRVMSVNVKVLVLPDDPYYIKTRARLRGEKSIGNWAYAIGKSLDIKPIIMMHDGESQRIGWGKGYFDGVTRMFAIVRSAIKKGLLVNAVMVSYAGNTKEIMVLESYRRLVSYADSEGIKVYLSIMSTAAGINVGPGAMSVAYCN